MLLGLHSRQSAWRTLYIGVTDDLVRRVHEDRSKIIGGFTRKYNVTRLVYFESFADIEECDSSGEAVEEMEGSLEDPAH
jgi:predicted GIY-YIG superfamily endonuclease